MKKTSSPWALLVACLLPALAWGDALVMTRAMTAPTIAEMYIEKDFIRIELEISGRELAAFGNLLPDEVRGNMGMDTSASLPERLTQFFAEDFTLAADDKIVLGSVRRMEPRTRLKRDEITGEPLPNQAEGERALYVELLYPLEGHPGTLTLKPPQKDGYVTATIGLMVYHMGLPIMDFRYLSKEETVDLDWEDPWYSKFRNKNLWRQYNEPISVFLYAEPFETRVEVIVRPKDIQQWVDLGIGETETLSIESQAALKDKVAMFLAKEINLTIDGQQVVPELQRVNFLRRTLKSSVVIEPPEELDAISATLGVIFSAPTDALPQEASITWNLFSPKMQTVRAAATDEAGPLPYRIRPDDNVLTWKNFLKNPTIPGVKEITLPRRPQDIAIPVIPLLCLTLIIPASIICVWRRGRVAAVVCVITLLAGAVLSMPITPRWTVTLESSGKLDDHGKAILVSGLLGNVYASFDYHGEEAIYDALAESLDGDLLTDIYLQTMKSLELASQGGARVKVKSVNLESAEFSDTKVGFAASCSWNVIGSVGHWGHVHQRVNRYTAKLEVASEDQGWRITKLDVLQEERVK